ncbi:amino acid adenylation [Lindgomyces ingoldianus]|uniref:Amino acid adenylation n=1 Tax=Lindgomyces ingoldianus TaxID=673940 RepID=A0ACB6R1M6_9PLEO|nr:amino acid adenylation [Lindgomyces ingoldianus]KAF2472341.1 amino acid adenylation [Lindgomyces ingoldianus]
MEDTSSQALHGGESKDIEELWLRNHAVPASVEQCVHELIKTIAQSNPASLAIHGWDGEMTYGELDAMSTKLAGQLVRLGIKLEDTVPLCFEKSMWTVVAMLAVLKAGGAFVPLDPEHPASRHKEIFDQTGAMIMLTSAQYSTLWEDSALNIVTVCEATIAQLHVETDEIHPVVEPGNAAYIIFTSGSTGTPKGVVLEHRAVTTSCLGHGRVFGFTQHTRALQFAAYTFDVCITETFTTLMFRGCICVPSESHRRNNLSNAINTMVVNWAYLTPTVARLLDPKSIVTLRTLVLGAERITLADCEAWRGQIKVINAYGPTESCIFCTGYIGIEGFRSGLLGKSIASVSWVVDPENHNKLAPTGSIGELLVEGPILARGYLNDAEKTNAAFIGDPTWLLRGGGGYPGRHGRMYKTGDLVHYGPEGDLIYMGRKDDQVKIRGQRVELGEIEHHVRECIPEAKQMAVEVIMPEGEKHGAMLAAFLQLDEKIGSEITTDKTANSGSLIRVINPVESDKKLAERLPSYMLPNVYFAIARLPMTVSGKTDRKRLREIGASFSAQKLAEMRTSSQRQKRLPSTKAERAMQELWAEVLHIEPETIGLDDSFFRLGGDSIAAMKLVGEARRAGIQLSVADIFRNPTIADLVGLDYSNSSNMAEDIPSYSLLGEDVEVAHIREEAAASCSVDASIVEDIYPCSPLQEGLVSLTSKRAGDYIMQSVLELRADIEEDILRAAWEHVVRSMPVLRTRIVQNSRLGLLQAVMAEDIPWIEAEGLEEYLEEDKSVSMGLGDPLTRYALVKEAKEEKRWMVWTIHHALYDGWSMPRIVSAVTKAYTEGIVEQQPGFHAFIKYLGQQDQEVAALYWQKALDDCQATLFPPLPAAVQQPVADAIMHYQCPPLPKVPSDTTTSTLVRAAWAIIASRYTNLDDVVFGTTVTGRNAPVSDIEAMIGPTIATVPVRVKLVGDQTVLAFLQSLQQQATEMIPYEQTGLQHIAKIAPGTRHACGFQTLLVVQPVSNDLKSDEGLGEWRGRSELQDFTTYGLMLQCTLAAEGVQIEASFDKRVLEEWLVKKLLSQFSVVMQQLARAKPEDKVADIDALTPEDRTELWAWNREIPAAVERCLHGLFEEQAMARPDAPAVCAWDGEMTYGELDALSTRLAGHLVALGVRPNNIVPLCFEKSMWTIVSMVAVLKAGGAFLLLDPSLPYERLKLMCSRSSSTLALASQASAPVVEGLVKAVVVITRDSMVQFSRKYPWSVTVQPIDTAYVIFTSGSTGEPKGCRIAHQSACSAVVGHGHYVGMQTGTRTLQFGSYSFAGSLAEILLSLVHGGCICIPTDEERTSHLASAISKMKINWAFLTSTVLDLLNPELVPSLTTLCIGGEPIRISQIRQWEAQVHLRQTYGSSETSGFVSSIRLNSTSTTKDVGRASTGIYWIVNLNDHNRLVPTGAIGEVLIEGPILGVEYIDKPDKTAATFIKAPAWRAFFGTDGCGSRLYKTGDLARHKQDGSIELLGQKDNQVKLRGQRIELGEIEHQAQQAKANDRLERFLPRYMVPTVFIPIPQLPATSLKKIDRKRLREIGASFSAQQLVEMRTFSQGLKRLPLIKAESAMQKLWAEVLHIEPESIGLDDSFFRLGGDSIAAMKLVGEACRTGMQLSVADIFCNLRLEQVTSTAIRSTCDPPAAIAHVNHVGPVEQSFAQGRLWFLEELHPGLTWYLVPVAMHIKGPLQLTALNSALLAIENRHETLRTTFATIGGTIYRIKEDDHVLSIVMHHIVSDGWSVDVLMRELSAFYSAAIAGQDPLSQVQPLPIQYCDFSVWQRQQAQVDEHQRQLSYWLTQLQTSRPAELLCDKPRPATLSGKADVRTLEISGLLYAKLEQFCKVHGVTFFVALLAAFRVHGVTVASLANQDVPFERIVSQLKQDRDLSRHPIVQLVFAVHSQRNLGQLMLAGVETEGLHGATSTRFDLEFHFFQHPDGLQGSVFYSTDLYAPETIDNMLSLYSNVLEACLKELEAVAASIPLLTEADYHKLNAMGLVCVKETAYPRESSIVDLFRHEASAYPSRIAVKDASIEMSYNQLDRASDVLARWLAQWAFAPESLAYHESKMSTCTMVVGPSATSLAYVMFTSGSTGQPKGVMVEHRGIVRLVRDNNLVQHLPASRVMAHMTNLAFDVSTWEIYACLLNGGTLVCIDAMVVLDPEAMLQIFNRHDIWMAVLTPALFRHYTIECPALFAAIEMLCLGGEALYPRDFFATENLLTCTLINYYGLTKNTGISTSFVLQKDKKYTNSVPIGRALSNLGAYVIDLNL